MEYFIDCVFVADRFPDSFLGADGHVSPFSYIIGNNPQNTSLLLKESPRSPGA